MVKPQRFLHRRIGLILALTMAGSASALCAQKFSARAFGGYGTTNGYGVGAGADAGIQFPLPFLGRRPVFVGIWGVYHAGQEFFDEDVGLDVEQDIAFYGLESAGIWLEEPIYIRGSGIIGAARVSREVVGAPRVVETNVLLSGGITLGKRFGHFFVGVEPSFPLVLGSDLVGSGFALYFTVGYVTGS